MSTTKTKLEISSLSVKDADTNKWLGTITSGYNNSLTVGRVINDKVILNEIPPDAAGNPDLTAALAHFTEQVSA